jgi:O-antigen/teichoic acid export membrane protein
MLTSITRLLHDTRTWPLADQGVVSLGNFLTNILLARLLSVNHYGTFAFMLDVLFVVNSVHAALVTYALSVRGAATSPATLRAITGTALASTLLISAPLAAAVIVAAALVGTPQIGTWASVALVTWMVQETLRRALMAHLRHDAAVWGDAVSYLGQAALIWLIGASMTLTGVFVLMAITSTLATGLQAVQLGIRLPDLRTSWRVIWAQFAFGRWVLLVALTTVFTVQSFGWAIVFFHGTAAYAGYQSVANLVRVSHPIMMSSSNVLVPAVAGALAGGGAHAVARVTRHYSIQSAALLLPFLAMLILFPATALQLVYGEGTPYVAYATVLRVTAVGYSVLFVGELLAAVLRGLGQSRDTLTAEVIRAMTAVGIGIPLTASYGVLGACWGGVIAVAARVASLVVYIRRFNAAHAHTGVQSVVASEGRSPA